MAEVAAYCKERSSRIDPEHFVDYYSARGWIQGRTPITDWKACIRNWEKRDVQENRTGAADPSTGSSYEPDEFFERATLDSMKKHGKTYP